MRSEEETIFCLSDCVVTISAKSNVYVNDFERSVRRILVGKTLKNSEAKTYNYISFTHQVIAVSFISFTSMWELALRI